MVQASEDLNQVADKYTRVIIHGEVSDKNHNESHPQNHSLLDFENTEISEVEAAVATLNLETKKENSQSDIDVLSDIFNATNIPDPALTDISILLPMTVTKSDIQGMLVLFACIQSVAIQTKIQQFALFTLILIRYCFQTRFPK